MIKIFDSNADDFARKLTCLLHRDDAHDDDAEVAAAKIIKSIREQGDVALLTLTAKLDKHKIARAAKLEIPISRATAALKSLQKNEPKVAVALRESARRIKRFHRAELQKSWHITERDGSRIGQRITPLSRVGVYVPGGTAAYPSSVLMTVIPAAVAGVDEIVMATPTPGGEINRAVLAAAALAGVHRIFAIGGAQAIAALAYGTATVPAVDKIVGPGNRFVAAAKRQVFGKVGIDSIAGPSEVVVVCDAAANSEWVAMDLCAQAEHDARAQAIAITDDAEQARAIAEVLTRIVPQLPRRKIIAKSLADYGAIITVADLTEAIKIVNQIAPEHLELMVAKPQPLMKQIRNAGAIFIGAQNAESLGDYCAGPNHVLPTAGTARFASPLGVGDFQKRSSVINMSKTGAAKLAKTAATLAQAEGLQAHAKSAEFRLNERRRTPA